MKRVCFLVLLLTLGLSAQNSTDFVEKLVKEVHSNTEAQLKENAHEFLDDIGPRLVGTPQMKQAHDWVIQKYGEWGIPAENQEWGQWKAWERGITHVDLVEPRLKTLAATQLAWSPSTKKRGITAEVIALPTLTDSLDFVKWLPQVKGKFVLIAMKEPTGRPDHDWQQWATPTSFEKMKKERNQQKAQWTENLKKTGYDKKGLVAALEKAGAAGLVDSYWSGGFGTNRIFGTTAKKIPVIDVELEDYTLLYRMVEHGDRPKIRVLTTSKDLGTSATFNTIATLKGTEKPEEYVILSAHLDSWDGGTGATDNGSGTLLMMEVMRILKKLYPEPKRTIIAGHWGAEEQGLNGSAAFVEDHPKIIDNIQVVFNNDNGTGRFMNINAAGFRDAYDYLGRWLSVVPKEIQKIDFVYPGMPADGATDHASFGTAGAPAFNLLSYDNWSYATYTWHNNRDTYDKLIWDDLKNNVIMTAVLTYMASEDPETTSRVKMELPIDPKTQKQREWPKTFTPNRDGGR